MNEIDEISISEEELEIHVQTLLDDNQRGVIARVAFAVSSMFLVLALLDLLAFSALYNKNAALMALGVSGFFAIAGLFHHRVPYKAHLVNLFMCIELGVLLVDGLAFAVITDKIQGGSGIIFLVVAAGLFLTRLNWLVGSILAGALISFGVFRAYDIEFSLSEDVVILATAAICSLLFFSLRRYWTRELGRSQILESRSRKELEGAIARIEDLSSMLPICANCKDIRDEDGAWSQIESYMQRKASLEFTHTVCPTCVTELYPEIKDEV